MNRAIVHSKRRHPGRVAGVAAATLLGLVFSGDSSQAAENPVAVVSPNGSVRCELWPQTRRLNFRVAFKEKPVIETSPMTILVDGAELSEGAELGKIDRYELNESYPWRGVHAQATNHCRGLKIPLLHAASQTRYTIEVRAFNDGVAFRHIIPGPEKPRVPDEATAFVIPSDSTVWFHDLNGHYEAVHEKKSIAEVQAGQWAAPPLTFKLPGGAGYASVTEAALVHYSGMALQADGRRGFKVVLGHQHPISHPFRLRYSNDIDRVSKPTSITGAITSVWRVVMVGADLNALVNSDIVPNLCPPPDPKLFPEGLRTDWIKPGRAVWKYLDGGANTFDNMKEFSRLAGELGFEYHVIEGFWSRWSDTQIKELVDYSRQRGVGLWLWRHSRELRTPAAQTEFFKKLQELGVVGAKIDFFDHEHQEVIDLYQALLAEAAKHHVMVNFHGANKPTGESRTWPNELIREGVRGMESSRLQARARHNTTLPFTRYLAGHADYTPVHFGARRGDTTWAHQVATAVVFTEPLLTYGAHPTNLLNHPALEMIKSIPSVWDETVVLPMSEIGELAAFARRSGQSWFLAVLNGPTARTVEIPYTFLAAGKYRALVVRDQPDDPAAVKVEAGTASRSDRLKLELRPGGGFVARFAATAN
jgi:alpha-glucosidase